ncbi:MAG: Zn-ribbon domain-containing OB-fold protein [Bordetella sp.]|nr:Zn-ribbon domain-containing OB-fold protein [Bordetella sp.]
MNALERTLEDPYVKAFPETEAFWRASAEGRFLLPRCQACGRLHWHPRAFCPFCHADAIEWVQASGRGEVYSFSIVRRPGAPYVLAYVRLDEGPILMTNIVDGDPAAVRVGMRVNVGFRATEHGRMAPVFRAGD